MGISVASTIHFKTSLELIPYPEALAYMEAKVEAVYKQGDSSEIWFLEHPPLYTAGSSAKPEHLTNPENFPTFAPGRGGQWTYHGPGQLVVYLMLDLRKLYAPRMPDLKDFVRRLERWIIETLAAFDIQSFTIEGRTGVWVSDKRILSQSSMASGMEGAQERRAGMYSKVHEDSSTGATEQTAAIEELPKKIAAIGVRIRHGISYHGISININPDLMHYAGIVPCGIADAGVTSFEALGKQVEKEAVIATMQELFETSLRGL